MTSQHSTDLACWHKFRVIGFLKTDRLRVELVPPPPSLQQILILDVFVDEIPADLVPPALRLPNTEFWALVQGQREVLEVCALVPGNEALHYFSNAEQAPDAAQAFNHIHQHDQALHAEPLAAHDGSIQTPVPPIADRGPPYTFAEIAAYGDGFPDRGRYCSKCRTFIPEFAFLSRGDYHRIRRHSLEGRTELARAELESATGCSKRWSKIWVIHSGMPHVATLGPPCPHCGKLLRTERARQCPHCLKSWHEIE